MGADESAMKLCMCDCCAEEGHPPGHEETRQHLSFKSHRLHRGLLRADLSAHDTTINAAVPATCSQRRTGRLRLRYRVRAAECSLRACQTKTPTRGYARGVLPYELRHLGRIGVSGDWGYAGVRLNTSGAIAAGHHPLVQRHWTLVCGIQNRCIAAVAINAQKPRSATDSASDNRTNLTISQRDRAIAPMCTTAHKTPADVCYSCCASHNSHKHLFTRYLGW